jgi:hypothetical protein
VKQVVAEHQRHRTAVEEVLADDPTLSSHPMLVADIRRRLDEDTADYLAKN